LPAARAQRPFFGADLEASKAQLFSLIGYTITRDPRSPKSADVVRAFHLSTAKERMVTAPARTSKSWSAGPEIVHAFFPRLDEQASDFAKGRLVATDQDADLHVWIVPPVYKLAKEWKYAREYLLDRGLVKAFGGRVETNTDAESQGNMQLTVLWPWKSVSGRPCRSTLQVRSAANEELLQAEQVKLAVVSEAADQEERVVNKFLRTRCESIIFPTTPKRAGLWLFERIQRGIENPDLRREHFQFDRFCNPAYDHAGYALARSESAMTFGTPENDPDFLEQYEGQWTFSGGQVLPFRWLEDGTRPTNVVDALPRWAPAASWFVAFDYGYDDPAVALFIAVSPAGEMCVGSEIYERHLTDEDLVERARSRARDLGVHVEGWIPDPQRPVLTEQIRRRGLPLFDRAPANVLRDRAAGYQAVRSALSIDPAVGRPRMTILRSCVRTITEMKNIKFKEGHHNEFSTASVIGDDHAVDALRYFCMSRVRAKTHERDWLADWTREQRLKATRAKYRRQFDGPLIGATPQIYASPGGR
jgi:hypothetical protein